MEKPVLGTSLGTVKLREGSLTALLDSVVNVLVVRIKAVLP